MSGVLDGVSVLDLSWGIAGPMAGMLLADQGASVTKIEPPGGDPFRSLSGARVWHRGKRSAVLDLADPEGRDQLLDLVDGADVLLESLLPRDDRSPRDRLRDPRRPESAARCTAPSPPTGRGTRHRHRPGFDALVAARTGLQWDQRGWVGGTISRMCGHRALPARPRGPRRLHRGRDRDRARSSPPRPGRVSAPASWPPRRSAPPCGPASTPGGASGSRPRSSKGCWRSPSADGNGASGPTRRTTRPGCSIPGRPRASSSALTVAGCTTGSPTRASSSAPPTATRSSTASRGRAPAPRPEPHRHRPRGDRGPPALLPAAGRCLRHGSGARIGSTPGPQVGVALQPIRSPEEALADPSCSRTARVDRGRRPRARPLRQVASSTGCAAAPARPTAGAPAVGAHTAEVLGRGGARRATPPTSGNGHATAAGDALGSPLDGVTVLDLGLAVAGPFGTQVLADLGRRGHQGQHPPRHVLARQPHRVRAATGASGASPSTSRTPRARASCSGW